MTMASLVNLQVLNSGRFASSFEDGFSARIAVYLLRGSVVLPSFCCPYAVLICTSSGFAAMALATCASTLADSKSGRCIMWNLANRKSFLLAPRRHASQEQQIPVRIRAAFYGRLRQPTSNSAR
jgi:hypothetical protein